MALLRKPRRAVLSLKGRLRLSAEAEATATVYKATITDLSGGGALVLVDLPCSARLRLFEKVHHCLLEFDDPGAPSEKLLAQAVWLEPQTSNGEFMTLKVGLSFVNATPEMKERLRILASRAA